MKFYSVFSVLFIIVMGFSSCKKETQDSSQREEIVYKQKLKNLIHFKETGVAVNPAESDFKSYKDAYLFFSALSNKKKEGVSIAMPTATRSLLR